ncbi:hypothetical protein [Saccharolobus islandicus]|uniref:hypothetical protein n=1 Tax=Saccharolobus islandicus TaxID=43080 RepID=UPI00048A6ED7|nr:hypothetical protein [Sulfolobus islandicus]
MVSQLMTDTAHEVLGGDKNWMGGYWCFPRLGPNDLRVSVYEPVRGMTLVELKVRISYTTGKHYILLSFSLI